MSHHGRPSTSPRRYPKIRSAAGFNSAICPCWSIVITASSAVSNIASVRAWLSRNSCSIFRRTTISACSIWLTDCSWAVRSSTPFRHGLVRSVRQASAQSGSTRNPGCVVLRSAGAGRSHPGKQISQSGVHMLYAYSICESPTEKLPPCDVRARVNGHLSHKTSP